MEFTKEEIEALRWAMDESHSDYIVRNNLENLFGDFLIKPLFTTYDDVEIYAGNDYWYIERGEAKQLKAHPDYDVHQPVFSTEKATQEYGYKKTPVFSRQEILKAVNHWGSSKITLDEIESLLIPF